MLTKNLVLILIMLVINLSFGTMAGSRVYAGTSNEKKAAKRTEKIKTKIGKLGTGEKAKVKVKLSDGTKLKGYVSRTADDNFVVTDAETGKATTVPYNRTKQVSGGGEWDWLLGVAVAAGIIGLVLLL